MQPTSQIILITLTGRYRGLPLVALETFSGAVADVVTFGDDGVAVQVQPIEGVAKILEWTRRLRRMAQDCPADFATLNITRGHATLVA